MQRLGVEQRADLTQRVRAARRTACRRRAPARRSAVQPEDHPHGGRLAGAVRAEEAGHLARLDLERQVVDGGGVAIGFREAVQADHRGAPLISPRTYEFRAAATSDDRRPPLSFVRADVQAISIRPHPSLAVQDPPGKREHPCDRSNCDGLHVRTRILCITLYCVLRTEMLKGAVDLMVLAVLSLGESYGYQVVKQLEANGWEGVGEATVYGTLRRLHDDGFLNLTARTVRRRPGPALLRPEQGGRVELDRQAESWHELTELVERTVKGAAR